jgi:putative hemolysin
MLYVEMTAIVLMTLLNGLLAMSEISIVSSRKSRLEYLANQGSRGARSALGLIDDPSRFLSTVQIGITLVGIVAGAFSGATLGQRLGSWLNSFAAVAPYGNPIGIGITIVGITYLSLIFGELVPKRIALAQPERTALYVAGLMRKLSLIAAPVVWVLHVSTESLLRLLGLHGGRDTTITEDEVKSLISEGTLAGIFSPQEKEMIEGVLRLADRSVQVIMTPRTKIVWVDSESGRETIFESVESSRFSRLLVCKGVVDHPVGVVHTKDLLPSALRCIDAPLAGLMTPLLCVPDSTSVLKLLNRFKKEKMHFAVVVDEHGATQGILTLTDVIEAIAGDLPEQGEESGARIVQRDDGSWLVDGTLPTDEVENITGIDMGKGVKTMAGFMMDHIERMPEVGASFKYGNTRFEVVDMDGRRIDKVLIEIDRSRTEQYSDGEK